MAEVFISHADEEKSLASAVERLFKEVFAPNAPSVFLSSNLFRSEGVELTRWPRCSLATQTKRSLWQVLSSACSKRFSRRTRRQCSCHPTSSDLKAWS